MKIIKHILLWIILFLSVWLFGATMAKGDDFIFQKKEVIIKLSEIQFINNQYQEVEIIGDIEGNLIFIEYPKHIMICDGVIKGTEQKAKVLYIDWPNRLVVYEIQY